MANRAYEGQSLTIRADLKLAEDENISGAIVLLKYTKPDKTTGSFSATIEDEYDGIVYYKAVKNVDLIGTGKWTFWTYVTFSDGREIPGDPFTLEVVKEGAIC